MMFFVTRISSEAEAGSIRGDPEGDTCHRQTLVDPRNNRIIFVAWLIKSMSTCSG
jgi:hypothetical protein